MTRNGILILFVLLLAYAGCSDDEGSTTPQNHAPTTPVLSPAEASLQPGASLTITATSDDADGDPVTFSWTFSAGSPTSAQGASVTWTAPGSEQSVTASVTASDGQGGETTKSMTLPVGSEAAFAYTMPDSAVFTPTLTHLGTDETMAALVPGTCHLASVIGVAWCNSVVFLYTVVPTLAFVAALTTPAVWIPPTTWQWNYTVEDAEVMLQAEVVAAREEVDWEMRISGTNLALDEFLWVSGTSAFNAGDGHWILNDATAAPVENPGLRVEWQYSAMDDRQLNYINVLETSEAYGDSLIYTVDGTSASVHLHQVTEGVTDVEWDLETGSGQLTNTEGSTCCWGPAPAYLDEDCD